MNKLMNGKTVLAIALAGLVAGCGGGGGSSNNTANQDPQGLWNGTSTTGYELGTVVLETGEYYGMFWKNGVAYGADHGTATVSGSSFSGNLQEFYIPTNQVISGNISGTFVPKSTMTVTTSYNNANTSTSKLTYNASYDTPASLAQITGTYTGNYYTDTSVNVSISSNGVVSGISGGCNIGGTVAPRATGKNVYNVNLVFSGTGCAPGQGQSNGVGILSVVNGSTYLYTAGLNSSQTNGFFWIGKKQ